jgi:fucose permease
MADRREVGVVYAAGLAQGLALVTFPAVSSILTSPDDYGLSSSAYGALFLPQAIAAVAASLTGARLTGRMGIKRVFLAGLAADVLAMSLLVASQVAMGEPLGYVMLLLATTSLGIGFGLTVPSLNSYAAAFFPANVGRATLYLNALLGLGTALAPLLSALFLGRGAWWALPLIAGTLLVVLVVTSLGLPLSGSAPPPRSRAPGPRLPSRFWVFAGFALLYGIVETVNGNWSTVYMTTELGASPADASLALAAFWGMVTVGRVLFAAIERRFPETDTYRLLPFVAAAALVITAILPTGQAELGVLAFGLAGLGCSALLPLTIGFAELELRVIATSVAGLLIALYQVGYGIAAFGVGPLESMGGISLAAVFMVTAGVALVMGALSFVVVRGQRAVAA